MAMFSGKQYLGAARDLKVLKRQEAEERNLAYQMRLIEASLNEEVPAS